MSGGKKFWFWWCVAWALFWVTLGWLVLPFINVGLFVVSLVAAVPALIGNERTEPCPVCGGSFPAQNMALHVQVRHPGPQPWPVPAPYGPPPQVGYQVPPAAAPHQYGSPFPPHPVGSPPGAPPRPDFPPAPPVQPGPWR